jgi:hypothetical protein
MPSQRYQPTPEQAQIDVCMHAWARHLTDAETINLLCEELRKCRTELALAKGEVVR